MKKYKIVLPIMLSILVPLLITGCNSKKEAEVKSNEVVGSGSTTDNKDASQVNTTTDNKDTSSGATTEGSNNQNTAGSKDNNSTSADKTNTGLSNDPGKTPNSNSKIIIDVKTMDKSGTFWFGMSKDDVISKLKNLKLEVLNEIEITNSKDSAEYGNKQIWAEGISFSFDKNDNQLYSINVNGNIATSLGLKVGDSAAKMEKLYGKEYARFNTGSASGHEYTFGKHYFRVFVEGNKVTGWNVSKNKLAK